MKNHQNYMRKVRENYQQFLKLKVENRDDLSLAYSPGVAEPCRKIAGNKEGCI